MAEVKAALEEAARKAGERPPSIAVLPFANISADPENEYFSDGLAEEINDWKEAERRRLSTSC